MALQDITITGSIGTYPTLSYGQKTYISSTDQESFPLETVTGSNGGSFPDLLGQTSSIGLFSPINQQWSGYNDTIAGLVAYTHSIQDEFINGEFSGSEYVVSNGSLTDANCQKFLEVNTTEVTYNPFFYVYDLAAAIGVSNPFTADFFLSPFVSPNVGEIYIHQEINTLSGYYNQVKYFKINRIDNQGTDNTLSLQELTDIRVKYSTIGIVEYPVISISEYPTYYLYATGEGIKLTSYYPTPSDNNILNFSFSASVYVTSSLSIPFGPTNINLTNYSSTSVLDPLSNFNVSTGIYTSDNTSNISLICNVSFTASTATMAAVDLDLVSSYETTSSTIPVTGSNQIFNIQFYNVTPIDFILVNSSYYLKFTKKGISSPAITISKLNWSFTQSVNPNSSANLTVLEPYLTSNFFYDDCNALYGNEDGLEYSNTFMKVDYDNGYVIPSNQEEILNGSAEPAPVKPYNYSLSAQILPRYNGVKVTQQNENIWTEGDIAPDKTPSVQTLGTYFAYFDWAGSTNNDLYNKQAFHITYLIDSSGSVFTPTLDSPYYPNLIDLFPSGKNANILPYSINGSAAQTQGTQSIYYPGVLPTPIIYTQTSSDGGIAPLMAFDSPLLLVPDYGSSVRLTSGNTYNANDYQNILDVTTGTPPITSPTTNFLSSNVVYSGSTPDRNLTLTTSTNKTQVVPTLTINFNFIPWSPYSGPQTSTVTLNIIKFSGGTWTSIKTENILVTKTGNTYTITSLPQIATDGDRYRITINTSGVQGSIGQNGGTFTLTQTIPPSVQNITAPYWTTGSLSKNILTGSTSLNSNVYNLTMTSVSGAGYYDCLPFNIQRLDQIRFEADETQVYTILSVSSPLESSDGRLYLTLDKDIKTGTNLASFFLRRLKPDPSFVIMNTPISPNSAGFLLPEFMSKDLTNNLPKIISSLHEKNII